MKITLPLGLLATFVAFAGPVTAGAKCLEYGPAVVSLDGALIERVYPGRPNYESIANGDHADRVLLLTLGEPVCVTGRQGEDSPEAESEQGVLVVQVSPVGDLRDRLASLVNHNINAVGTLYHGITGGDRTRVLLMATAAGASRDRTSRSTSDRRNVERAIKLCEEIALPNSMARLPGFDATAHQEDLMQQRVELVAVLRSEEGVKSIKAALAAEGDELQKGCLHQLLSEAGAE